MKPRMKFETAYMLLRNFPFRGKSEKLSMCPPSLLTHTQLPLTTPFSSPMLSSCFSSTNWIFSHALSSKTMLCYFVSEASAAIQTYAPSNTHKHAHTQCKIWMNTWPILLLYCIMVKHSSPIEMKTFTKSLWISQHTTTKNSEHAGEA